MIQRSTSSHSSLIQSSHHSTEIIESFQGSQVEQSSEEVEHTTKEMEQRSRHTNTDEEDPDNNSSSDDDNVPVMLTNDDINLQGEEEQALYNLMNRTFSHTKVHDVNLLIKVAMHNDFENIWHAIGWSGFTFIYEERFTPSYYLVLMHN